MDQLYDAVISGMSTKEIVNAFVTKTEFTSVYPRSMANASFATKIVDNVVGSSASATAKAAAVADITAALTAGMSRGDIVYQIFTNLANKPATDADWAGTAKQMANQVEVAKYYTETLNSSGTDLATLRKVVAGVTATTDVSSPEALAAVITTAVPPAPKSFVLTSAADNGAAFEGGAGNDFFSALVSDSAATTTLSPGDSLSGGAGSDVLSIAVSGGGQTGGASAVTTVTAAFVLDSIETVNVSNYNTGSTVSGAVVANTNSFNMAQATGVSKVALSGSSASSVTQFQNLGKIVDVEMGSGSGSLTVNYTAATTAGTSDVQKLLLNGQTTNTGLSTGTRGTFTMAGVETLAITSTGSTTNRLTVDDTSGLKAITASGDRALVIAPASGKLVDVTSVDASSMTAGISYTTAASASQSLIGGAGSDYFTFSGNSFAAGDTVDGGAGNDFLSVATTASLAATDFLAVTNVETLVLTGAAASISLASDISPKTFNFLNAGSQTITFAAGYKAASTVYFRGITYSASGVQTATGDSITNSANIALDVYASQSDLVKTDFSASPTAAGKADTTAGAPAGAQLATIVGGTGVDSLYITPVDTRGASSYVKSIPLSTIASRIDNIVVMDNGDDPSATATALQYPAGFDLDITTGAITTALKVDGSSLDGGTVQVISNVVTMVDDETLVVDASLAAAAVTLIGGGGADTLTGGTVNDVIHGGGGADSIIGSAGGNDSIDAGPGDDVIEMGTALSSADTINGGDGNDTLNIASSNFAAVSLANVSNVENLGITGTSAVTLSPSVVFTAVRLDKDSSPAAQSLTLPTGYTGSVNVYIDSGGDKVVNSANIALTVYGNDSAFTSSTTITGGTGVDTLSVKATSNTLNLTNHTSINSIVIRDSGDELSTSAYYGTSPAGKSVTFAGEASLNGSAASTTKLTIDASALDSPTLNAAGTAYINSESLIMSAAYQGSLVVAGGGSNDTIYGGQGTSGDSLSGGDFNDTFMMGANLSYLDTVSGGNGSTDRIYVNLSSAGIDDSAFISVSSVEQLYVQGGGTNVATIGSFASTAGIGAVYNATAAVLKVSAAAVPTGLNVIGAVAGTTDFGANGGNSITTGLGNDNIYLRLSGLNTSDAISGTAGTDTLHLYASDRVNASRVLDTGSATGLFTSVNNSGTIGDIGNISKIVIVDDIYNQAATTTTLTFDASYGATASKGQRSIMLEIDGSGLDAASAIPTGSSFSNASSTLLASLGREDLVVDASQNASTERVSISGGGGNDTLSGGAGNDVINGGAGADVLVGGAGADIISGGSGDDTITGGSGVDVMTGGSGNDVFVFNSTGFDTGIVPASGIYYGGVVASGSAVSTGGFDKILDFGTNDAITNGLGLGRSAVNGVDKLWTDTSGVLRGAYDATAQTFTFSATGVDSLFVWDRDGDASTTSDLVAVVLVGYVDAGSGSGSVTGLWGNSGG